MEAHARAGIDIYGNVLRYAEVEQYGTRFRLLRLGSCEFDFDVGAELLSGGQPQHLETVAEAVGDVFSGSIASALHVALHPPGCYSFFTPVPAETPEAARKVRLQQEAAVLAGVETPLRLTADALYSEQIVDDGQLDWVHVLAVEETDYGRLEHILNRLPKPRHRLMASMQAAALVVGHLASGEAEDDGSSPFTLAIGWYPTHIEYTLCRDGRWYFSHYTDAGTGADSAYFSAALLGRLRLTPGAVGRVLVYGSGIDLDDFDILRHVFAVVPERLNPLRVVDLDPASLAPGFDAEAYVACVGAAL